MLSCSPKSSLLQPRAIGTDLERLCLFIRKATQLDPSIKPGPQLVLILQSILQLESAAIFDADLNEVYRVGEWFDDLKDLLQNICIFESSSDDPDTGLIRRVLKMGKLSIGAMLLRGESSPNITDAISWLTAITFDRYHAFASEQRTESARQTEQLRTTVLDSLAHAYKTPLTVVGAASSGLLAMGGLTQSQAGLVSLIDEQTELLSQLTTRLLGTARLGDSDLIPHHEAVAIAPLIDDVVASLRKELASALIKVEMPREELSIQCDRSLIVALLTQYVENAGKYADSGSTITIQASREANEIVLSVNSVGPVIPVADQEWIFDRYYRSASVPQMAPGTGIGLSVARRAAQAHGGTVWVTSEAKGGTTFYASLPAEPKGTVAS